MMLWRAHKALQFQNQEYAVSRILVRLFSSAKLRDDGTSAFEADLKAITRLQVAPKKSYADTIQNLKINSETRVVIQGFTGKQATFDAQQSLDYGTKIVGGVRPGKDGEHLGLPVFPSMRAIQQALNPDATAVYVAAPFAAGAIEEAVEAEIPLIVAVAEHIPLHDMIRVKSVLQSQCKSRLVGPNSPGMINPVAKCRIGFHPIPFSLPGNIGIVAKSGTLSYETIASTTRAGLGQSMVIGVGGDILSGTSIVDALEIFEHDEATKGIIIVGEVGGSAEQAAAQWITLYRKRVQEPKPILALIAGFTAPKYRVMGHAGAFYDRSKGSAVEKKAYFKRAGVMMTDHPAKFGEAMKLLLSGFEEVTSSVGEMRISQRRSMHTLHKRPLHRPNRRPLTFKRFHLKPEKARSLLDDIESSSSGSNWVTTPSTSKLTVRMDPALLSPVVEVFIRQTAWPDAKFTFPSNNLRRKLAIMLHRGNLVTDERLLFKTLSRTMQIFAEKEAVNVTVQFTKLPTNGRSIEAQKPEFPYEQATTTNPAADNSAETGADAAQISFTSQAGHDSKNGNDALWQIVDVSVQIDDAAYRSAKRQEDLYHDRYIDPALAHEVDAEKDGIVYIRLPDPIGEHSNIGTLVNGAGLAMNTTDVVTARGGHCANFLDTGGKASSATVKASFRLLLGDPRVEVVFVNIFGGLTKCDMIAEGILMAYKDLGITLPVVVRLRGTNEKEGQRMIADSGLPLLAYDDFEEAVAKVIELGAAQSRESRV